MSRFPLPAAVLAAGLALQATAPAAAPSRLTASNGLAVAGEAAGFEVFARANLAGRDYFCAAGEFAQSRLGAGATDRLTVIGALGPSPTRRGQRSVTFALSPPAREPVFGDPFLWVYRTGDTLTVGHARFVCNLTTRSGSGFDDD